MNCVVDYDILNRRYKLAIFQDREDGTTEALTVTISRQTVPEAASMPFTELRKEEGRELFKALALGLQNAGFLPRTEYAGEGELKATKVHLEDLRRLYNVTIENMVSNIRARDS